MVEKIRSLQFFRWPLACLVCLWGFVSYSQAQTRVLISQSSAYDQNVLRNYSQTSDWVSQTSINLQHIFRLGWADLQAEYAGNLNLFYYYRERLSHAHQLRMTAIVPVSKEISWQIESAAQLRKYQPLYDIYDHHTWRVLSHWELHFWQRSPLQAGYQFRQRVYWDLSELTYSEQTAFLTIKHFFPTRTTVIGQLNWGYKQFARTATADRMVVTTNPNSGRGHGYRYGKGQQMFHRDSTVTAYNLSAATASQLRLNVLLAQSIFATTGISLQYQRQLALSQDNRYLLGVDYFYYQNDDLFDDPYSFESHEWEAMLTQMLPWSITMKLAAFQVDKNYFYSITPDSAATAEMNVTQRQDSQVGLGMTLMKRATLRHLPKGLTIYCSVNYLSNRSNDPYFDYRGFVADAGCSFSF
ncbi:MAG: hypothetical protein ONB11_01135 [candidate division KSB1 bacterium]|nr:hypothetical protein [candidate division KSB1 bacterium]